MEQFPGFPAPDFAPNPALGAPMPGPIPVTGPPPLDLEPRYSPLAQHLLAGAQGPPDPVLMHYRPSQPPPDEKAMRQLQDALAAFGHA